jgi:very-short-patch-repair endonuclease
MRPEDASASIEEVIARVAGRQHGVVTRAQLDAAGVSPSALKVRLERGSLIRVHRGVFRAGHAAPSTLAAYIGAVLACGEGSSLCGMAAAYLHQLVRGSPPRPEVRAAVARRIPGVLTHASRDSGRDVGVCRGIRVTSVARTVVDISAGMEIDPLSRVVHEAAVRFGVKTPQIEAVLQRRRNAPGSAKLKRVLRGDSKVVLSPTERSFLKLLEANRLPLPETNRPAGGRYVDCRWPEQRLTVELDSYTYHGSRHAWEKDRLREREAYARGDEFRRYTRDDVLRRASMIVRELQQLLSSG